MGSPLDTGKIYVDLGSGAQKRGNINIELYPEESDKHHRFKTKNPTIYASVDRNNIPLRDGIRDRNTWVHVVEHLTQPLDAIKDGYRILKKGGTARISVPNPRKVARERKEHLYSWHPDTFHNLVKRAGYTILEYGGKMNRSHSMELKK